MRRWGTGILLALLHLAGPASLGAELLAEYSCQRPVTPGAGTWHNVEVAAGLLDGMVMAPGKSFSFNAAMARGNRSFKPGNTLMAGKVIQSQGGGICQVSTALYNAVLIAGLKIRERHAHSFYTAEEAYFEPGADAAVSNESRMDFRFSNSGPEAVTLSVKAMDGRVSVSVFGTGPAGRRWLKTRSRRIPKKVLRREEARPGFDGYVVSRSLCRADAAGNTLCSPIGTDRYLMISEWVTELPAANQELSGAIQ